MEALYCIFLNLIKMSKIISKVLHVTNLEAEITSEYTEFLTKVFSVAGKVVAIDYPNDRETGRSRGFVFVTMDSEEAALSAIKMVHGSPSGRSGGFDVTMARPRPIRTSNQNGRF
jgi:RNA recognition motif-containing protein